MKTENTKRKELNPAERRRRKVSATVLAVFIVASVLLAIFAGKPLMAFVKDADAFQAWVDENWWLGRLSFIGMVVLQLVVAVIPGEPLEFAAGYAFGAVEGTVLCLIGCIAGSALVFLMVRRFGIALIETFFDVEKINEMKFLKDTKRLNLIIFVLFFIPGTPKDILTYAVGLTKVQMIPYLIISNFARIPSVISSTLAGSAVGTHQYHYAAWVYGITAVLSIIGVLIYRRMTKSST